MTKSICSIENCERPVTGRGWCSMHYQRWLNHGDPLFLKQRRGTCSVDGCDQRHGAKGLCHSHYNQQWYQDWSQAQPPKLVKAQPPNWPAETWLPIPGFEGHYEVSNRGRIRSVPHVIHREDGRCRRVGWELKALNPGADGRVCASLLKEGKSLNVRVHRLVLLAFVGPPPPGMECCHNDGDASNNRLENLRWGTKSDNMHDRVRHGTHHMAKLDSCLRGHALVAPNLRAAVVALGRRGCLACSKATKKVAYERSKGRPVPDLQILSDRYFLEIMANDAAVLEACLRGHALSAPNLRKGAAAATGSRHCLACFKARGKVAYEASRGRSANLQEVSDRYYMEIMSAA